MADSEWLAAAFEEHRDHLRAVAYRLLGSAPDADDAVQDTWLRLTGADTSEVENLGGWLTTVVARVSLNMLRSRRHRLVFVPLDRATVGPSYVKVAYGKKQVKDAPSIDTDGELPATDEEAVFKHYGLAYEPGAGGERRLGRR